MMNEERGKSVADWFGFIKKQARPSNRPAGRPGKKLIKTKLKRRYYLPKTGFASRIGFATGQLASLLASQSIHIIYLSY